MTVTPDLESDHDPAAPIIGVLPVSSRSVYNTYVSSTGRKHCEEYELVGIAVTAGRELLQIVLQEGAPFLLTEDELAYERETFELYDSPAA